MATGYLGHSIRGLRSAPGFTTLVVLVLGLGIGANCALFTVVNSLLLRPLPYQRPTELVDVSLPQHRPPLEDLKRAQSFDGVAEFLGTGFNVMEADGARYTYGFRISPNLFSLLGVQAAIGRIFMPDEYQPVVILGYDYWRRISGQPSVVGQSLTISGQSHTIVGVLPADFYLSVRDGNLFVPNLRQGGRTVARLKPGVSPAQAQAEMDGMLRAFDSQSARAGRPSAVRVIPLPEAFRNSGASTVLLLQATVGLVLLITCANIANLSLARATARRKEFAIRAAIGAGRWQLFSQLIAESALLAGAGAAIGLLLAHQSLSFLEAELPGNIARALRGAEALSIDATVLAFTAGISLLTVMLFGLAPALRALNVDVMSALKASAGGITHRQRFGHVLVIAEMSLALMLLIGAGLTLKSLLGLRKVNLGFSADHVLRVVVEPPFAEIVRRCEAIPGVNTVGVLAPQLFPFGGPRVRGALFEIQGRQQAEARAEVYTANPAYFQSVRIPLLRGRQFTEADTASSAPVALISEIVAKRYWGQEDPTGSLIRPNADQPDSPWVSIAGVVGDVRNPVGLDVQPTMYRPIAQSQVSGAILLIRTAGDPRAIAETVRKELRAVSPNAPFRAVDLGEAVRDYINPQRFITSLLGVFAALGLSLAAVGIYGVMRYWVVSRISEIGTRIALGAEPSSVVWLTLRSAGKAIMIGLALGVAGSLALRRVIESQLYRVSPTDPAVIVAVSALMVAVAFGAALLPALRAARVDPLVALRHE